MSLKEEDRKVLVTLELEKVTPTRMLIDKIVQYISD